MIQKIKLQKINYEKNAILNQKKKQKYITAGNFKMPAEMRYREVLNWSLNTNQ